MSPDFTSSHDSEEFQYDFLSSVNHAGSAGYGHYWAVVKGPDGKFHRVDDETQVLVRKSYL